MRCVQPADKKLRELYQPKRFVGYAVRGLNGLFMEDGSPLYGGEGQTPRYMHGVCLG